MDTNAMQIFQLVAGSGGLLGILILIFRTGKLVEKIDIMEKSNTEIKCDLKEIKANMGTLAVQVGKLETRVEERTLKVVHVEKSG